MTLGQLIDDLKIRRDQIRDLQKNLDAAKEEYERLERDVMAKLQEQGVTNSRSNLAIATITEQTVANVVDWDAFIEYVIQNHAPHLIQRRIASRAALEEIEDNGETIPGVTVATLTKLGLRSL